MIVLVENKCRNGRQKILTENGEKLNVSRSWVCRSENCKDFGKTYRKHNFELYITILRDNIKSVMLGYFCKNSYLFYENRATTR